MCQSSDAAFHCLISSGVVQARQTSSNGCFNVGLHSDFHAIFFVMVCGFTLDPRLPLAEAA